jgi:putative transposase
VEQLTLEQKRMRIQTDHPELTVARQCALLGLARSSRYYAPLPADGADEALMRLLDRQYTATPFYGVRRMTAWLDRQGWEVNPKRVRRLMRLMGLEAIYPKPRTSVKSPENKVYPYLLKGLVIDRPDQVWCADITYLPMRRGWLYLVVVMDWFSRYVLAWELSVTLDAGFCVAALRQALTLGTPGLFNTDQGSQFTSLAFTGVLWGADIRVSMDGRGRAFDNIFIERLWRSVKYEEVYLHDYQTPAEARLGLGRYWEFYNHQRPHQGLDYRTPAEVYGLPPTPNRFRGPQAGMIRPPAVAPVALRAPSATAGASVGTSPP